VELTRSKIAYNLHYSPHRQEIAYGEGNTTYVFSSELYKQKFLEKLETNRQQISASLTKRFGVLVRNDALADFRLYTTIEKRGFLLIQDRVEIECRDRVVFDSVRMTLKNSAE
jgi:hypothetical protein